jgi:hypothetical protein
MQTVVIIVNLVVLIWIMFVVSFQGLDLRKRSSWLYGAIGFLCGVALSIDISSNLIENLIMGAMVAFMILFIGVTMRRHKQKYGRVTVKSLVRKYGKDDSPSLFAKLVKRLFDKYK